VATLWQSGTWYYCAGRGEHYRHIGGSSVVLCNAVSVMVFVVVFGFPRASYPIRMVLKVSTSVAMYTLVVYVFRHT
jgi:hypothetical protein